MVVLERTKRLETCPDTFVRLMLNLLRWPSVDGLQNTTSTGVARWADVLEQCISGWSGNSTSLAEMKTSTLKLTVT